jgi:hypothetical protein
MIRLFGLRLRGHIADDQIYNYPASGDPIRVVQRVQGGPGVQFGADGVTVSLAPN